MYRNSGVNRRRCWRRRLRCARQDLVTESVKVGNNNERMRLRLHGRKLLSCYPVCFCQFFFFSRISTDELLHTGVRIEWTASFHSESRQLNEGTFPPFLSKLPSVGISVISEIVFSLFFFSPLVDWIDFWIWNLPVISNYKSHADKLRNLSFLR